MSKGGVGQRPEELLEVQLDAVGQRRARELYGNDVRSFTLGKLVIAAWPVVDTDPPAFHVHISHPRRYPNYEEMRGICNTIYPGSELFIHMPAEPDDREWRSVLVYAQPRQPVADTEPPDAA